MKVIAVTGVPGTGKTMLSKKLTEKLGFYYLDVNKLISKRNLSEGYDKKRKSIIVDMDKLIRILIATVLISEMHNLKGIVIDSHLAHFLPKKSPGAPIVCPIQFYRPTMFQYPVLPDILKNCAERLNNNSGCSFSKHQFCPEPVEGVVC